MSIYQSDTLRIERDTDGSFVLTLDVPGKSVNVITRQVLADLEGALDVLAAQSRIPVLVVRSSKKTGFLAGADNNEFVGIADAASARALSEVGQKLFARLEALPGPSVAVIHGPCLGGGLELALACDYRLVFDKPGTQLGLPEVELGLLPGWGGTQRLPRIVGLEKALTMILSGKRVNAREARQWGLSDAYAGTEAELRGQYASLLVRAIGEGKRQRERLPIRTWRQRLLESNPFGRRLLLRGAERLIRTKVPDDMPAPIEALEAVRIGIERGTSEGYAAEREAASRLALSSASRNLIGLFLQREAARKSPGAPSSNKKIGVVGAGVMGAGIAQLAALSGYEVVVQEVNQTALDTGRARIEALFAKASEKGRMNADEVAKRQAAVRYTITWDGFAEVAVVIEAALEDVEVKRNLFREMDARTPVDTVLATNTSSLIVSRLQDGMKHPRRVAGLHFFNPVHKMPLVEVVRTPDTDEAVIDRLVQLSIDLGKTPVVVGDRPGFVVNRVLMPYLNEALRLVGEGLKIEDIDRTMKRFGMPMGPLELLDQIGLDVAAHVGKIMRQQLGEQAEAHPGFAAMSEKGWLGQKSGTGFYLHQNRKAKVNTAAQALLRGTPPAVKLPEAARLADARERLVLLMVNEAAQALAEGLAPAKDIDLAMVFGTGWAPHRGGPLAYADTRTAGEVVRALESLASRHGPRFAPGAELKRRAETGQRFRV